MYYNLKQNGKAIQDNNFPLKNFVAVLSKQHIEKFNEYSPDFCQFIDIYRDFSFTRGEFSDNIFYGSIFIPSLLYTEHKGNDGYLSFDFLLEKDKLFIFTDSEIIKAQINEMIKIRIKKITDITSALYYLFESLIDNDLEKVSVIQDQLSCLEDRIYQNMHGEFSRRLTEFRGKTLKLSHYYLQFTALVSMLCENSTGLFNKKQAALFSSLSNRLSLLKDESDQLWDFTSQVREIYQEQLDLRQNQIMKLLTVLTALFFPLSLATGWYGMNFKYMPELDFKYSYPALIIISIGVVVFLCIWFKRKNFW